MTHIQLDTLRWFKSQLNKQHVNLYQPPRPTFNSTLADAVDCFISIEAFKKLLYSQSFYAAWAFHIVHAVAALGIGNYWGTTRAHTLSPGHMGDWGFVSRDRGAVAAKRPRPRRRREGWIKEPGEGWSPSLHSMGVRGDWHPRKYFEIADAGRRRRVTSYRAFWIKLKS